NQVCICAREFRSKCLSPLRVAVRLHDGLQAICGAVIPVNKIQKSERGSDLSTDTARIGFQQGRIHSGRNNGIVELLNEALKSLEWNIGRKGSPFIVFRHCASSVSSGRNRLHAMITRVNTEETDFRKQNNLSSPSNIWRSVLHRKSHGMAH